jgi:hypothetical protein
VPALVLAAALILVIGGTIGALIGTSTGSGDAGPGPSPVPPKPPIVSRASAAAFAVSLAWEAPAGGQAVSGYRVLRDDVLLHTVSETTYVDTTVLPGRHYTYAIESIGARNLLSAPVLIDVRTKVPPLSAARVGGTFVVHFRASSVNGATLTTKTPRGGWRFRPHCARRACDAAWRDLGYPDLRGTAARSGASYHVHATGYAGFYCGSKTNHQTSTIEIQLHVTAAHAIDDAWRATKLAGTMTQTSSGSGGCVVAHVTYAFTAKLRH